MRLPMKKKNVQPNTSSFTLHSSRFWSNQLGLAPLVLLAVSGLILAGVLILVATQSVNLKNPLATPIPTMNTIAGVPLASPVLVDPNDPSLCDDQYNADCASEGDDVDPADLAGPD